MIRRAFLATLAAFVAPTARAQAREPIDVVRRFYAKDVGQDYAPWSKRLRALYDAADKKGKEIDSPVAGMDFEPAFDGQDTEPGWEKTLRLAQTQRSADKARIRVNLRNGRPVELLYDLVREDGAWRVDDIRSVGRDGWTWSKLLIDGAQGK